MVHRILAVVTMAGLSLGSLSEAKAFCRTTICAAKNPAPECNAQLDEFGELAAERDFSGCLAHGAPLYWEQPCMSFSVQREGSPLIMLDFDQVSPIIERAFNAWPNAQCASGFPSIAVTNFGPLECERREFNPTGPNANAVIFRDLSWPHDKRAIALTTVSFDPISGRIFGADMEINTVVYSELSEVSLEYVVTHEAGHFYGLDHSFEPGAVMDPGYSVPAADSMIDAPVLSEDDIAAICTAYPPDREVTGECRPEPEHGYAVDCGGNVFGTCSVGAGGSRRPESSALFGCAGVFGLFFLLRRRRGARAHKLLVVPPRRV
jgi:hypothetical protein